MRAFVLIAVLCSGCSVGIRPYPATLLPAGRAEIVFSSGVAAGRRLQNLAAHTDLAGRYSTGPVEIAGGAAMEVGNTTLVTTSMEARWGAVSGPFAVTPSAGMEAIFGRATQWLPSVGLGLAVRGGWVALSVIARGAWRDLAMPELSVTPSVQVSYRWASFLIGAEILNEPTTGNTIVYPHLATGVSFDVAREASR
jgi:hypothetical protein